MKRDSHLTIQDGAMLQPYDSSYNIRNILSRWNLKPFIKISSSGLAISYRKLKKFKWFTIMSSSRNYSVEGNLLIVEDNLVLSESFSTRNTASHQF